MMFLFDKEYERTTNLFAACAAVCHSIVNADFTKIAAVDPVISEAAIDQPCLVKVWMSRVDVRQLNCYQIFHLSCTQP